METRAVTFQREVLTDPWTECFEHEHGKECILKSGGVRGLLSFCQFTTVVRERLDNVRAEAYI